MFFGQASACRREQSPRSAKSSKIPSKSVGEPWSSRVPNLRKTFVLHKSDVSLQADACREDQAPPLPILREFLTISQSGGFAPDGESSTVRKEPSHPRSKGSPKGRAFRSCFFYLYNYIKSFSSKLRTVPSVRVTAKAVAFTSVQAFTEATTFLPSLYG